MSKQIKSITKTTPVKKLVSKKAGVKKMAVKKVTLKKGVKKTTARSKNKKMKSAGLICATDEHCFWTTDGRVLKSLADLVFAFGSMEETVFIYHANETKNDFADWVEYVLKDAACAEDLRKTKSPKRALNVTKKYLKSYR